MTDLVAKLRLDVSANGAGPAIAGVAKEVTQLGQAGAKAAAGLGQATAAGGRLDRELQQIAAHGSTAKRGLDQADASARSFERSASGARGAGALLATTLGLIGGRELVAGLKDAAFTMQGYETGLGAVTGGSGNAAAAIGFVREEAGRLGLVLRTSIADYMSLAAATNGTSLAGEKTRQIWLGLNEAGATLHLSQERQQLAMMAISQIASKGVVSQEELRQQLAEALPGAYQVAQRAMGMTGGEFNKLVASGKLLSEDFLPKFANQLRTEFGPSVDKSLTTPIGKARIELAAFQNNLFGLEGGAGSEFLSGMRSGLADLNEKLASPDAQEAARALGHTLGEGLSTAAHFAAFLAENLDTVVTAAQVMVAVGVAKWLTTTATEAARAGAAYIAQGQAATAAGSEASIAAGVQTRAITTLRGSVEAVARAEVVAAGAARDLALAEEQAAVAALAQARAQTGVLASATGVAERQALAAVAERDLAAARAASVAATGRAEAAVLNFGKSTTAMGAAAQGAKGLLSGVMGMLGGPWGIALMAAAGGVALVTHEMAESEAQARASHEAQSGYADAMAEASKILAEASVNTKSWSGNTGDAISPTDKLTTSTRLLTEQTIKLGDARRQAALAALQESDQKLRAELASLEGKAGRQTTRVVTGEKADGSPVYGNMLATARVDQVKDEIAALLSKRIQLVTALPAPPEKTAPTTPAAGKPDKAENRARINAADRARDIAAQNEFTQALIAGGAALDNWKVKEAGRQAVEREGLADRPKLTAAEQALVATIRSRAEETERLKIANERIEKSIGISKSADLDTAALQRRSIAAALGETALEALQVKEAGLQVLQQLGIDSLDQLGAAERAQAEAAIKSAKDRELQAIATQKAERVADSLRDLDTKIASEKGYAAALASGMEAEVAYARAEFERQEIERAGKTLTEEQVKAIRAKADALFAVQGAADEADLVKRQEDELRLARLTNQERDLELRYLQRKELLLRKGLLISQEELEARAHAAALADQAAAQDAKAIGDLKENLRQTFIESGHLAFEDVGDFLEQRLRQAVYDALLAEPIDILINAVVGGVSGLSSSIGGAVSQGGVGGLASLFNSAGGLAGLEKGVSTAVSHGLAKMGVGSINSMGIGSALGTAAGGAGTGMLVSSIAGMLGMKQNKGNQIGGTIGGIAGSFLPIPGGAIIGSVVGNLLGGLVGGKKSNNAAVATLDATGNVMSIGGGKATAETTAAAQQVAAGVAAIQAALVAGGAKLSTTVSTIDIGVRDQTHIGLSNGSSIQAAVGDVQAAIAAASQAIVSGASWATQAQTDYAQKMLAAGATLDQVIATMQVAGGLSKSIDDAIAQLTNPAEFERKSALDAIEASYQALKTQAQELVDAGLVGGDVLAKLAQLRDLQVADSIKRLGDAATDAAAALEKQAAADAALAAQKLAAGDLTGSIQAAILKVSNPSAYARQSAIDTVDKNYNAMKAQALDLIAAGLLSSDVLGQLETMRDLQLQDALANLAGAANDATDAFADARPQLQSWLSGLATSANSPLNPAEQRAAALSTYNDLVARARSGDADALGQVTGAGDQLLASDRTATSSAADRLALYNKVTGDIAGLTQMSGASANSSPQVIQLSKANKTLDQLKDLLNPELIALAPAAPIEVRLSPWLKEMITTVANDQTTTMKGLLEKLLTKTEEVRNQTVGGLGRVEVVLNTGLNGLAHAMVDGDSLVVQAINGLGGAIGSLSQVQAASNAYMRQAVAK